jgi:hypothetical protein
MTRLGQIAAAQARAHYPPGPAARPGRAESDPSDGGTLKPPRPARSRVGDMRPGQHGRAPRVSTRWPGRASETPRATTSPTRHENGVRVP